MGGSNSVDKAKPVLETQFTHVDEKLVLNHAKKTQTERKNVKIIISRTFNRVILKRTHRWVGA